MKSSFSKVAVCFGTIVAASFYALAQDAQVTRLKASPRAEEYKYNSADGYYYSTRSEIAKKSIRDAKTGFYISAGIGGAFSVRDDVKATSKVGAGTISEQDSDWAFAPFGKIGYIIPRQIDWLPGDPNLALEFEGSYFESRVLQNNTSGVTMSTITLSFIPQLSFPAFENRVRTYFGAGPTIALIDADGNSVFGVKFDAPEYTTVGLTAKVGVEYFIYPWWSIFGEYGYLWLLDHQFSDAQTQINVNDDDNHLFRMGFGFHF